MNFVDKHYDGISLELQTGFLKMNPDILEALKVLKTALENSNSSLLPSRLKCLYELDNWGEKAQILKEERGRQEERFEQRKAYQRKLINCELFETEHKTVKLFLHSEMVTINGTDYYMGNMSTNRDTLKVEYKRLIKKLSDGMGYNKFKSFLEENKHEYVHNYDFTSSFNKMSLGLRDYEPTILIDVPHLKVYTKGKKNPRDTYVRAIPILTSSKGYNYISFELEALKVRKDKHGNLRWSLEEYEKQGSKYIKLKL